MSVPLKKSGIWYLLLAVFAFAFDFISKQWIMNNVEAYNFSDFIQVIPGFFRIVHVHNEGAAFSFLSQYPGWQQWIFGGVAVVVSVFLTCLLIRTPRDKWFRNTAYALIIGGALGNLWDRMSLGYVVDFLDFFITTDTGEHHYPAFNIADCAICVGVAIFFFCELFSSKNKENEA